jgi:hypothetical protein
VTYITGGARSGMAGELSEECLHSLIASGGLVFDAIDLADSTKRYKVQMIKWPTHTMYSRDLDEALKEIVQDGVYYLPDSKHFPVVDALVRPRLAFQMTISQNHPPKLKPLLKIMQTLMGGGGPVSVQRRSERHDDIPVTSQAGSSSAASASVVSASATAASSDDPVAKKVKLEGQVQGGGKTEEQDEDDEDHMEHQGRSEGPDKKKTKKHEVLSLKINDLLQLYPDKILFFWVCFEGVELGVFQQQLINAGEAGMMSQEDLGLKIHQFRLTVPLRHLVPWE